MARRVLLLGKWNLAAIMADRRISDEELATRLGQLTGRAPHPKTVYKWKTATERPNIRLDHWDALPLVLNCSHADLIGKEEN